VSPGNVVVVFQWWSQVTAGPTWSGGRSEAALQIRPAHVRQTRGEFRRHVVDDPAKGESEECRRGVPVVVAGDCWPDLERWPQ